MQKKKDAFQNWIIAHDESLWFIVLYIVLSLLLTIFFGLFWLVLIVFLHFLLELLKNNHVKDSFSVSSLQSLWEIKLDIGIILLALVLVVYMDILFGAAGINAGVRIFSRFAAWSRQIRAVALLIDEVGIAVKEFVKRLTKRGVIKDAIATESHKDVARKSSWQISWGIGDYLSVGFGLVCLVLIFIAPYITHISYAQLIDSMISELHPFSMG